jgi:biotin carboxylase
MKKVVFLGASKMQLAPIKYARAKGYFVITIDNQPSNIGHKMADLSYNCSTTDFEAVLDICVSQSVDGIVCYASDPAAYTQSFVANRLGHKANPIDSVKILSNKNLFREFLLEHKFNVPKAASFHLYEELEPIVSNMKFPLYMKPIDSSGSKGVSKLEHKDELFEAFNLAKKYSRSGKLIIEEEIKKIGYQIAGDGFYFNENLVFYNWAQEHFNKNLNGLVPIGESFPVGLSVEKKNLVKQETERLLKLLNWYGGALNFDFVFDENGDFYFLELGPRNGGCLIPEVIKFQSGVDLIAATVELSLGNMPVIENNRKNEFWSSYMIHSENEGVFDSLQVQPNFKGKIVELDLWVKPGDYIYKYSGSDKILGTAIIKFDNVEDMISQMDNMCQYINILLI